MAQIKSQIEEEAEGCFTSMIDVVFLLLIFFVLQPFKSPELRIAAYLPKNMGSGAGNPDEPPKPPVRIRVLPAGATGKDGVFVVGERTVNDGNRIAGTLLSECNGLRDTPIILAPHPLVHFQHVLKVLDQCSAAEMSDVKFEAAF